MFWKRLGVFPDPLWKFAAGHTTTLNQRVPTVNYPFFSEKKTEIHFIFYYFLEAFLGVLDAIFEQILLH